MLGQLSSSFEVLIEAAAVGVLFLGSQLPALSVVLEAHALEPIEPLENLLDFLASPVPLLAGLGLEPAGADDLAVRNFIIWRQRQP